MLLRVYKVYLMTIRHKTVSAIVVAALLAATMAGCSHNSADPSTATVPAAAPGQKPTAWNPNNAGMMAKRAQMQQLKQMAQQAPQKK